MKKILFINGTLLIMMALFTGLTAYCQSSSSVERNFTFGGGYQCMNLDQLNRLLKQSGYGELGSGLGFISVVLERNRDEVIYSRLGLDFGRSESKEAEKPLRGNYYRINMGFGMNVWSNRNIAIIPGVGLSYALLNLRLYQSYADTTSVADYIQNQPDDTKRLMASQASVDLGMNMNIYSNSKGFMAVVSAGYQIGIERADWSHDLGDFRIGPRTNLGGFYMKLRVGIAGHGEYQSKFIH